MAPVSKRRKTLRAKEKKSDIQACREIVDLARRIGEVNLTDTMDGDIDIYHNTDTHPRIYIVKQTWRGKTTEFRAQKTELMGYLISLREKRRAYEQEQEALKANERS